MAEIRTTHEEPVPPPRDYRDEREYLAPANPAPGLLKRISWGAIFAGTVIALGVTALLSLLGMAIGFGAIEPRTGEPFEGVGIGTAIWWIVTSIIALAIGGYVAGRASGLTTRNDATSHGAAVWGLVTIITLWMATSAIGSVVNTAANAVSSAVRTTTNVASAVVDQDQAAQAIERLEQQMQGAQIGPVPEDVQRRAARTADDALDTAAAVAWYAFFASLLSLIAAIVCAGIGAPRHTWVADRPRHRDHDHDRT